MSFLRSPRYLIVIAAVAMMIVVAIYAISALLDTGSVTSPVPSTFTVNGKTYSFTYVATNDAERSAGLMNKKVTNTTTMLFAFPGVGVYQFWMYDTNTSLDMIWVSATGDNGTVAYVYADALPCYSYSGLTCPNYGAPPANYVIEAKAGFAAANGIVVGTHVQFG
jgi:uncharacterized membrane protein (UPF0127 family)